MSHHARMGQKIGIRAVTASTRRCVVAGCAERPERDTIICARHARALAGTVPAEPPDNGNRFQ